MEGLTVPLIVVIGIFGSWCIWLSVGHYQNKEEVRINSLNTQNMQSDLQEIKEMQSGMNTKLDQYIAQENQFLKNAFSFMQNIVSKRDNNGR